MKEKEKNSLEKYGKFQVSNYLSTMLTETLREKKIEGDEKDFEQLKQILLNRLLESMEIEKEYKIVKILKSFGKYIKF